MNKFSFLALVIVLMSMLSCAGKQNNSSETKVHTPESSIKNITHITQAIDSIVVENISIPIYNFKAFEPFLTAPNNDTLYVINFWATWCAPCVEELPYFWNAAETFKDKAIKMIFVSLDLKKDYEGKLAKFVKEKFPKNEVIALHEPNANIWIDKVDKNWDGAIPVTLFYKGDKRSFYATELGQMQLNEIIKSFF